MPTRGRGRPPLTEDAVRGRIADYLARYGVSELNAAGLPVFPAGKRETRQHREWIVLYKAFARLHRRQAAEKPAERAAALAAQGGLCPICLEPVGLDAEIVAGPGPDARALVHPQCRDAIRLVGRLGPAVLDRLRKYLGTAPRGRPKRGKD